MKRAMMWSVAVVAGCGLGFVFGTHFRVAPGTRATGAQREGRVDAVPVLTLSNTSDSLALGSTATFEVQLQRALQSRSPSQRTFELHRICEALPLTDLPGALRLLLARSEPEAFASARLVAGRWALSSTEPTLRFVLSLPRSAKREQLLESVVAEWAIVNASDAVRWAGGLPAQEAERNLAAILSAMPADTALSAVADLSISLSAKRRLKLHIMKSWVARDPAAAAQAASTMPDLSPAALGEISFQFASRDPKAALAWAQSLPSSQARAEAVYRATQAWSEVDPASAIDFTLHLQGGLHRKRLLESITEEWAGSNPSEALAWITQLPEGRVKENGLETAVQAAAATEPATAWQYVQDLPESDRKSRILAVIAESWARQDPAGAIAWSKELPEVARKEVQAKAFPELVKQEPSLAPEILSSLDPKDSSAIHGIVASWSSQDLPASLKWLQGLSAGEFRDNALRGITVDWVAADPAGAAEFVMRSFSTDSDQAKRDGFLRDVLKLWAGAAPEEALAWAQQMPASPSKSVVLAAALGSWASVSPVEAARYVASMPPTEERSSALSGLISEWTGSSPETVADWVAVFPQGPDRDTAIGTLALSWSFKDPAAAAKWLYANVPGEVHPRLEMLVKRWVTRDPASARNWLKNTTLPADFKSQFAAP